MDDILITYDVINPSFVKRYKNINAKNTSKLVTGLNAGINYYYRVRGLNDDDSSAYSNVISLCTCADNPDSSSGNAEANKIKATIFPNPTSGVFNVNISGAEEETLRIEVFDVNGKKVYQSSGRANETFVFGKQFAPGIYILYIEDGKTTKTFKLIKTK